MCLVRGFDNRGVAMASAQDLITVKQYIRRNWSVAKMKAEADKVFECATEEVTITSTGFEGGTTGGQMNFRKMTLLQALEELIMELDPSAPREGSGTVHPDFSQRSIST